MALSSSVNPATLYRPALYGAMLSAILTGINICQTYGYVNSKSDSRLFKGMLILLVLFDLLGSIVITLILDHNVIGAFGDPIALNTLTSCRYFFLENLVDLIMTTAAQSYTAWSIYMLDCRWWPLCVLILIGVFGEIGLGIYVVEKVAHFEESSSLFSGSVYLVSGLFYSIASLTDITATIGLCTLLHTVRTSFESTNQLINKIMFNFINRGVLITIVQVLFLAFWFVQPKTLNWTPFYFSAGKLYLTTMLAMLNMRDRTQNKHNNLDSLDGNSYSPKNLCFGKNTNGAALAKASEIHIARTVEIFNDNDSFPTDAYKADEIL
ncbi:hypothetical protein K439DRAFT_1103164 [Ramaria rubella]|nr:hypothetical protein K439DRAFT_1103164 [Ramaria rubella]